MKRKRFTEEQLIVALKAAERGQPTKELCRQIGVTQTTFYRWKSKYGGMEVSDARKLRTLEDENRKLKKLVADLGLSSGGSRPTILYAFLELNWRREWTGLRSHGAFALGSG